MSHFQNQYGAVPHTDEYGNQILRTDEYGNPVYQSAAPGDYGAGGFDSTTATGMRGHSGAPAAGTKVEVGHLDHGHHGLHRSGSSSSSSSEDDGQGGRRKKKGLKEKIKEKLPGVGQDDHRSHASATTSPGGYDFTGEGQHHEKKGMMEKIKEKLPGHHH